MKGSASANWYKGVILRVSKLSAGDLAVLRRGQKNPLEDTRLIPVLGKLGFLFSFEKSLIAVLFSVCHKHAEAPWFSDDFNFGDAFQRAYNPDKQENRDIRFRALLSTTDSNSLSFRLRQAVRLVESKGISIDFAILLRDLYSWADERKWIQRKWAQGYYKFIQSTSDSLPSGDVNSDTSGEDEDYD